MKKLFGLVFITSILTMAACQSTTAANPEAAGSAQLKNTLWKLTSLADSPVETKQGQRMASLTLVSAESNARIVTACNSGGAGFTTSASALKFSASFATKMACPEDQMQQESAFFQVIEATASYKITGEVLELFDVQNKLLATFHSEYLK